MDHLVKEHIKSYQVWQHRRTIVTALNLPEREIPFTSKALALDAKNYHTWAYRQWALLHFYSDRSEQVGAEGEREGVWRGEREYVEALLEEDVRNNSAWNHRFFVSFESGQDSDPDVLERELLYAFSLSPISSSLASLSEG